MILLLQPFLPYIGYEKAQELVDEYKQCDAMNFQDYLIDILGEKLCNKVLSPANLVSLGYRI